MEGTHLELRKWFVGDMAHVRPERQGSAPAPCRRQIGCSLKTAGRVLVRIYSPGSDRSVFSVLAADTLKVDDFYIGAKAAGKSSSRCLQRQAGLLPPALRKGVLERLLAPGGV